MSIFSCYVAVVAADHIGHNLRFSPHLRRYSRVGAAIGRPRGVALITHRLGRMRTICRVRICIGVSHFLRLLPRTSDARPYGVIRTWCDGASRRADVRRAASPRESCATTAHMRRAASPAGVMRHYGMHQSRSAT